jgi:aminopeptidase
MQPAELPTRSPPEALNAAAGHVRDILAMAIRHDPARPAVVVFDTRSELSLILAEAYRRGLPGARFIDFDATSPGAVKDAFEPLEPGSLVVLIQSENFRLEAFRIRVELFKRGLKVIEHPHLSRMRGPEAFRYIESLAYDPGYYRTVGRALKERIDRALSCEVAGGGERLFFSSPFESAKLNVGDYEGMRNVGGQFPIGEVFTEARDLDAVNGRIRIFAFADLDYMADRPEKPITLVIEKGRVAGAMDATEGFEKVLAAIRADEGEVRVRELGFGLNRAFTPDRMVSDIGTFERMCGIHLSLGAKHAVYPKPEMRRKDARHHVDVFAAADSASLDGDIVFRDGAWTV